MAEAAWSNEFSLSAPFPVCEVFRHNPPVAANAAVVVVAVESDDVSRTVSAAGPSQGEKAEASNKKDD
jgi:hypothetical protein